MFWGTQCSNKVECTLVNEKDVLDSERDFKIDAIFVYRQLHFTLHIFRREHIFHSMKRVYSSFTNENEKRTEYVCYELKKLLCTQPKYLQLQLVQGRWIKMHSRIIFFSGGHWIIRISTNNIKIISLILDGFMISYF